MAPRYRIAFAGASADEERPQVLVAKTGDEASDAQVREVGAGPRGGGRSELLDCPADDRVHVDPLAGAARFKAHFDHAINGVLEWFAGAVNQGHYAAAQRLGQVKSVVADRKIHLGLDPTPSLVVAGVVTSCQKHDTRGLGEVLDLAQPPHGTVVIGDGAYERRLCYAAAKRHRVTLISPPGKRAVLHPGEDWRARNRSIEEARFLWRPAWKVAVGYHRRFLAEVSHAQAQSRFRSAPPLSPGTQSDPRRAAACSPPQPLADSRYRLGCLTAALPVGIRFMQQGRVGYWSPARIHTSLKCTCLIVSCIKRPAESLGSVVFSIS